MKQSVKNRSANLIALIGLVFCLPGLLFAETENTSNPKYVFLLIGDGMGTSQRMAAEYYYRSCQLNSGIPEAKIKKLEMNNLPVAGLTSTFSSNAIVTDSAAAATAIATGHKTRNGVISMDSTKSKKLDTVAEFARKSGKKVGIVSNVWINHATPAAFYAHQPSRGMYYEIAMDLANSDFDYFGGGFARSIAKDKLKGRLDPVEVAKKNGFTVVASPEEMDSLKPGCGKVWAYDKTQEVLYYEIDRPTDAIKLKDFVVKGIELLDTPEGFFFMIEGGKIDWVCHANDAATTIKDTIAFNDILKVVLEFYAKHKEDTLVIVTGDHETGGMKFGPACINNRDFARILDGQKGSDGSFHPIVRRCKDEKMSFEEAKDTMGVFFNIHDLNEKEADHIKNAFIKGGTAKSDFSYGNNRSITIAWTKVLDERAGVNWTSYSHTGVPVMTTAIGVKSDVFGGTYDNTDLSHKLRLLLTAKPANHR